MTLSERITAASKANLPLTLTRPDIIELAGIFEDAEESTSLAQDITQLSTSTEFNGTGSFRLSVEQVKYVQTVIA